MKRFLTKEEGKLLKEKISHMPIQLEYSLLRHHPSTLDQLGSFVNNVTNIIDLCTQKSFPDFTTAIDSDSYVKIHGGGEPLQIGINISYDSESVHAVSMDIKQFKYFVKGCQEICDWIKEQA